MRKTDYIDPIIGTVGDEQDSSFHGGGKTHPGACLPGGMVQLSPDTTTSGDNGTGYNYCQSTIEGFSFNHMSGIGWYGDLGNIQIMPVVGACDLRSGSNDEAPLKKGKDGWKSPFSHEKECAKAGYYSVTLEKYGIFAETSATQRTGILRLTYPKSSESGLIFNLSRRIAGKADYQSVKIVDNRYISGHIHCTPKGGGFGRGGGNIGYELYFYAEISKPAKSVKFFENEELVAPNATEYEGEDVGALLTFDTEKGESVCVKCAISYTDEAGARLNFDAECRDKSFDIIRENAVAEWGSAMECVSVEGSDEIDKTIFYTCLYHTLLDPRIMADCDGRFRTAEGRIKRVDYTHRTMLSGWDVYRSEFPLLTLISPETVNDEINSLINIASEKNSSLPRWELMGIDSKCMVGDPALLIFADAYVKGIRNYDSERAYELCYASALAKTELNGKPFDSIRRSTLNYLYGAYVTGNVSETLELLLADYAMENVARGMEKSDDVSYFNSRRNRYKENYDPKIGYMNARDERGNFAPVTDKYSCNGCVESNIYQQSWFVPYDVEGVCELFGKQRSITELNELFEKADLGALWNENYNHSNEPCHNLTHYFNILGVPHLTQYWTRRVQKEAYRTGAFGFCGNEDVGQLSAWYVLSALGLAQICPSEKTFQLNTPLFKSATLKLDPKYHSCKRSTTVKIECDKDPLEYPYIDKILLNGNEIKGHSVSYDDLTNGAELTFILTKNSK